MRLFAVSAVLIATALSAMPAARAASSRDPLTKLQWRSIGPAIGGRVVAIAGVPSQPGLFYFGGVDGGIWRTTDYGLAWQNISDGTLPSSSGSIGAIAVAPSNAKIIYAGSGESDIRGDFVTGDGIYKSTDVGKTWSYAGLRDTHTISAIAIDPRNPDVVYASSMGHVFKDDSDRGVFKSTDGGKSWRKVLYVDGATGAIDVVMDPRHPSTLYAAMWQAYRTPWKLSSGGPGSALYKTTDGGQHWTNISKHPGFSHDLLGRIGVTVAASNPNVVYAIVQSKDGGVFRSNDAGASWHRVNDEWKLRQRAYYYMSIFADPSNPNTVYAPQVDALFVSHGGGRIWTRLRTPHGDNHIVWIDPRNPSVLLEGNDGGATVSTDAGKSWSNEHNQPTGQFYHISIDNQFPFHVYGAQQDEGSIEGPSASNRGVIGPEDWHNVAYGESTFVAPQPDDPNVTYGSGYFSIFMRYDMAKGQMQEISPWPLYQEGAASDELKYRLAWTHPIFFSPADSKSLMVGAQYVLRSDDYGKTWTQLSPDLTRNDPSTEGPTGGPIDLDQTSAEVYPYISALAVSPLGGSVMWAGSSDGLVHVTTDGGARWTDVTPPGLPQRIEITSIEPSHAAGGTAYLTASAYMLDDFRPYVFETTDYGKSWRSITSGIPSDSYVFVVRSDPKDANLLFLGTKNTVYVSFDGGSRWQPLSLNLPRVQVRDIAVDPQQGAVAIATHGRAFWVLDDLALLENASQIRSDAQTAQLFTPQDAWLTHYYGSSFFAANALTGINPPFGVTVFFTIPDSYNGTTPVTLSFLDSRGTLVRSFNLHLRRNERKLTPSEMDQLTPVQLAQRAQDALTAISPGANRFQWDLRYPDATGVTGFYPPVAAGGLEDNVNGPTVVPGTYTAVLGYGGQRETRTFTVALDPGLHATQDDFQARLALGLRIHEALDTLDKSLNQAITVRDRLTSVLAHDSGADAVAKRGALASLNQEIANGVQLQIQSSEGSLLHETKLHSHLAYLAADVELAYERPTAAEYAVFDDLNRQATVTEAKLSSAVANAQRALFRSART